MSDNSTPQSEEYDEAKYDKILNDFAKLTIEFETLRVKGIKNSKFFAVKEVYHLKRNEIIKGLSKSEIEKFDEIVKKRITEIQGR